MEAKERVLGAAGARSWEGDYSIDCPAALCWSPINSIANRRYLNCKTQLSLNMGSMIFFTFFLVLVELGDFIFSLNTTKVPEIENEESENRGTPSYSPNH